MSREGHGVRSPSALGVSTRHPNARLRLDDENSAEQSAIVNLYFDRQKNRLPFAWAAQCGYLLRRRRRLFTVCSRFEELAVWTDESGHLRLNRAWQKWWSVIRLQRSLERVSVALKRRYLLRAMHRWFDYLPIRAGALICHRVLSPLLLQKCFDTWRWNIGAARRALKMAMVGRIRRQRITEQKQTAFHGWLQLLRQNQRRRCLRRTFRRWRYGLASTFFEGYAASQSEDSGQPSGDMSLSSTNDTMQGNGESKNDVTDSEGASEESSRDDGNNADDERDPPLAPVQDSKPSGNELVVNVEVLLKDFCVAIDLDRESAAMKVRQELTASPQPVTSSLARKSAVPDREDVNYTNPTKKDPWTIRQTEFRTGEVAAATAGDAVSVARRHIDLAEEHGGVPSEHQPNRVPNARKGTSQLRLLHAKMRQRKQQLRLEREIVAGETTAQRATQLRLSSHR